MEGPGGFYNETLLSKPKMRFANANFTLSATDLANHLSFKHLTELNRALAKGKIAPPAWRDPDVARIQELTTVVISRENNLEYRDYVAVYLNAAEALSN